MVGHLPTGRTSKNTQEQAWLYPPFSMPSKILDPHSSSSKSAIGLSQFVLGTSIFLTAVSRSTPPPVANPSTANHHTPLSPFFPFHKRSQSMQVIRKRPSLQLPSDIPFMRLSFLCSF